jgi:hypothetical protein
MTDSPSSARVIALGRTSIECSISKISAVGATIRVTSPSRLPDQFSLVDGFGKTYACNVVWRTGASIGVVFA